jgi:type IX secretion system PorP/SprF family membrane protein
MKKVVILMLVLVSGYMKSQHDVMISQYMFNGLFLNPAYAGSHKYYSSTLLYRNQWANFAGAPKTILASVDGLMPTKSENMGLGLILSNDRIGAREQNDIYANYSYQLKFKDGGRLAFGLKAGVSNYQFKNEKLTYWDRGDQVFETRASAWLPKFGFGAYYFTKDWYAGLSIPTLIAYDSKKDFTFDVNQATFLQRHYYMYGGYVFKLDDKFKMKPSMLIKYLPSAPIEADVNLHLMYKEQIWLGAGYRTRDGLVFTIEYQTNTRFRVGYAYDAPLTRMRLYSAGSHEIMIGYDFGKDIVKIKTPRYF